MQIFTQFVLYFAVYAFLGWLWELVYCRVAFKTWHWRGYLTLPFLPIYGFSVVAILLILQPYVHNPFLIFVGTAALISLIEFVSSWTIEKIFNVRLWDYSNLPYDIKGRVSLPTSLAFGAMGLLVVYVLHPTVAGLIAMIDRQVIIAATIVLTVVIAVDFINSTISLARVRGYMKVVGNSLDDIQDYANSQVQKLLKQRRKFRYNFARWYRWNIERLRRAFPEAVATSKSATKRK